MKIIGEPRLISDYEVLSLLQMKKRDRNSGQATRIRDLTHNVATVEFEVGRFNAVLIVDTRVFGETAMYAGQIYR